MNPDFQRGKIELLSRIKRVIPNPSHNQFQHLFPEVRQTPLSRSQSLDEYGSNYSSPNGFRSLKRSYTSDSCGHTDISSFGSHDFYDHNSRESSNLIGFDSLTQSPLQQMRRLEYHNSAPIQSTNKDTYLFSSTPDMKSFRKDENDVIDPLFFILSPRNGNLFSPAATATHQKSPPPLNLFHAVVATNRDEGDSDSASTNATEVCNMTDTESRFSCLGSSNKNACSNPSPQPTQPAVEQAHQTTVAVAPADIMEIVIDPNLLKQYGELFYMPNDGGCPIHIKIVNKRKNIVAMTPRFDMPPSEPADAPRVSNPRESNSKTTNGGALDATSAVNTSVGGMNEEVTNLLVSLFGDGEDFVDAINTTNRNREDDGIDA